MALIVSLVILVFLTILAVTGLRTSILEEQISGSNKQAAMALFAAEQGVSEALDGLFDGTITAEADVDWSASGTASGTGYEATYTVRHLLKGGDLIVNDDGRNYLVIDSTGQVLVDPGTSDERMVARRMLEVAVALEMGAASNVAGLIGCNGITGGSNFITSSYSSSGKDTTGDRGDVATTNDCAFMYMDGSSDFDITGEIRSTGALYLKSDALIRRDALATLRVATESDQSIRGSLWTNGDHSGSSSHVVGDRNRGQGIEDFRNCIVEGGSLLPNPVVPVTECDPWNINDIFDEASEIIGHSNNEEIGISHGGDYSGSGTLGVNGHSKDYYFRNFALDDDTVYVRGDVRIYVDNDFTMKSVGKLILDSGATLKIYVENGNFWIDSNSKLNHDPDNNITDCDPGGCPIDLRVYSKHEDFVKDQKNWIDNNEPDVWEDSGDIVGVKLDSNSVFFGVIYAPLSHVVLYSNAQIYGSVRGKFITADSNLEFHYDEDLDILWTGVPLDYKLVYWNELYPE
jgi:hypothetical protein